MSDQNSTTARRPKLGEVVAEVSKEEAYDAAEKAAWPEMGESCGHRGCEEHREAKRLLIHCRAGGLGADWPLADVVNAIVNAQQCAWVVDLMGHDLLVVAEDGRRLLFEVGRPKS
jgi:hypothetical protein